MIDGHHFKRINAINGNLVRLCLCLREVCGQRTSMMKMRLIDTTPAPALVSGTISQSCCPTARLAMVKRGPGECWMPCRKRTDRSCNQRFRDRHGCQSGVASGLPFLRRRSRDASSSWLEKLISEAEYRLDAGEECRPQIEVEVSQSVSADFNWQH